MLAARRVLFALSAAWSVVALGTLVWIVIPTEARMALYDLSPVGVEVAVIAVAAMAVLCLAASLLGWVVTPFGWDWLSAAPPPGAARSTPPPSHSD